MPRLEELSPPEMGISGPSLERLAAGAALGLVVRGLVSEEQATQALSGLDPALPTFPLAPGAHSVGCMLAPTLSRPEGPALENYLAAADATRDAFPLADRLHEALARLFARPVVCPTAADGRPYAKATLRRFAAGAESPLHCDTYRALECLAHLDGLADRDLHLSWYLTLQAPAGGELVIADRRDGPAAAEEPHVTRAGDLVVFDAGRWYHRVAPCHAERITLGGFASPSRDHALLYAWG